MGNMICAASVDCLQCLMFQLSLFVHKLKDYAE